MISFHHIWLLWQSPEDRQWTPADGSVEKRGILHLWAILKKCRKIICWFMNYVWISASLLKGNSSKTKLTPRLLPFSKWKCWLKFGSWCETQDFRNSNIHLRKHTFSSISWQWLKQKALLRAITSLKRSLNFSIIHELVHFSSSISLVLVWNQPTHALSTVYFTLPLPHKVHISLEIHSHSTNVKCRFWARHILKDWVIWQKWLASPISQIFALIQA